MDKSHRLVLPLTADEYEAIGALAVHYSHTEMLVTLAIWTLLKVSSRRGAFITSSLSLKRRFELLLDLAAEAKIDVKPLKEVHVEYTKEDGLDAGRNRYIHGVWMTDQEKAFPLTFSRAGKAKPGGHTKADDIEAVTRDIAVQGKKLEGYLLQNKLLPEEVRL